MTDHPVINDSENIMETVTERQTKPALLRGWRRTCPRCGRGRLFERRLSVAHNCEASGLDLSVQRADDGPAYLTIVIVGHIVVPLMVPLYRLWDLHPGVMATGLSVLAVALSLYLLPRIKGAMIGLQWARHLHGF
ncbi:DUF983 domain-containing protein [Dinoroseobacter sp. S124A]|uniref:DUF983 domain-containing protein n=1 Tax=Dinoroseobacter sp. S124A TaxID=3415128 RepID=UPI003C79B38D